jgi:4-hydroxybenzoate polyprenyltransferase
VVDLDGTLLSTNLLVESASAAVISRPLHAPRLLSGLLGGRGQLKRDLASVTELDVASLPYREDVLSWLRAEHAEGRRLILASASDARFVQQIADHLGIFEQAFGTGESGNLKADAKRELLVSKFGDRGFDYIGNHRDDLAVWAAGDTAHVVADGRLAAKAATVCKLGRTFETPRRRVKPFVKALRPRQWVKNALVAVPLLTAQLLGDWTAVWQTAVAIATFSLVASSVYVLNDIADVTNDRHHPKKCKRPFASGELSLMTGWLLWPVLAAAGFGIASALLSWQYVLVLLGYLVATVVYTFWAKRTAIGDVAFLGCLYTIRIIAGAAAIGVTLTIWLLTYALLFFLSLALVKRVSELTRMRGEGVDADEGAKGRGYRNSDLELLSSYGIATSIGAVVVFSLYVDASSTTVAYATPELLWASMPVMLVWLMRAWLLAHRGEMNEDPIVWATRDWRSVIAGGVVLMSFLAANVVAV